MKRLLALLWTCGCASSVQTGVDPIVGCLRDSDCQYGFYCQAGGCQQAMRTCQSDADCVLGESCQPNPALGCRDPSGGLDCPAANLCLPADVSFCCPCQTDADCALGGYCVTLSAGTVCSSSCTPFGCDAGTCCPDGSSCGTVESPDAGPLPTCLPGNGVCPTTGLKCQ